MDLTPQQRRELRAKAHHLHPVVSIGQQGLTPMVLNEIDLALTAHGLIKIRVHSDDRAAREALLADIVEHLHAAPVQHLGKLLIVWRPRDDDDAPPAKAAKPMARKTTAKPREAEPVALPPRRRMSVNEAIGARALAEVRGARRSASAPVPRSAKAPQPRRRRGA